MKSKKYTYKLILIFSLLSVISFYSFDQQQNAKPELDVSFPPLVKKELAKKLEKYKKTIIEKCRKKAFEAAESYIDSLVAEELKFQSSDTLKFPAKPIRPNLQKPIILNDSTVITPIIK